MGEKLIIRTRSSKGSKCEQVDACRDSLTILQSVLDFVLEFPRQRRRMLGQEFENVGANEILIISHGDTKDIDNANRVMLNGEVTVPNDEVLR